MKWVLKSGKLKMSDLANLQTLINNEITAFMEGMDIEYAPDSPIANDYNFLVPNSCLGDLLKRVDHRFEEFDDSR